MSCLDPCALRLWPGVRRAGGLGENYGGTCTDGGDAVGFVTGSVGSFDRADALENALRSCLGLPSLPDTIPPASG